MAGRTSKIKKNVLFLVKNPLMLYTASYLYGELDKDPEIRPWICFTHPERFRREMFDAVWKNYRTVPYMAAQWWPWDLALYPDHDRSLPPWVKKVYLRHGVSFQKRFDGELYHAARFTFRRNGDYKYFFAFADSEWTKDMIVREHPRLRDRIRVAGSLQLYQNLILKRDRQSVFREWGLDPDRKTVVFLSTWGDSLMKYFAEDLLEALPRLIGRYNVVVSSHPKTAEPNDGGYLAVTEKFKKADWRHYRFIYDHSWRELLGESDLIVSDHTSAVCCFLPFMRHMVFVDVPGKVLVEGGGAAQLKRIARVVPNLDGIDRVIEEVMLEDRKQDFERLVPVILGPYESALQGHIKEIRSAIGAGRRKA